MNISENLQNLRKAANMSQEQLAEKLNVSRQAVSKWESGNAYPETDKLIVICDVFECSMDSLVKGKISDDTTGLKNKYEKVTNMLSKGIAFGVAVIMIGVVILMLVSNFALGNSKGAEKIEVMGIVALLICVTIAVPIFICVGIKYENFKKKNPKLPHFYTENEIETYNDKFPFAIAAGVSLILIGVILLIALYGIGVVSEESTIPVSILLSLVTIAVPIFIYSGIQKDKYDIDRYNREVKIELSKNNELIGKISGVIMLIATSIYLAISFIFNIWHISWLIYPIAGMICGIVGIIFTKENED